MTAGNPTLYLVRHGQTQLNHAKLLQGRSDLPLNDTGRRQAEELGARLASQGIRFSRVYTSPLQRAVETARLIAPNAEPLFDERLIEMDYGPYEGMDLMQPAPEVLAFFMDFVNVPAPAGMEPLDKVVARLGVFLEELRAARWEGNLLLSTHAIALKGALEYLTPESRGAYWSKNIGNCALFRAELVDGRFTVPELFSDVNAP